MGPAALPVHGGGSHPPVHPAGREDVVGVSGGGDAVLCQPVHVHPVLDVLPEVWALVKAADNRATEFNSITGSQPQCSSQRQLQRAVVYQRSKHSRGFTCTLSTTSKDNYTLKEQGSTTLLLFSWNTIATVLLLSS